MTKQRNREEAVNTQLAVLISKLGVTADAETIHFHGKQLPDVLFELRGLRVVIEGKFADVPNAEKLVLKDARKRVRTGIAHIAVAIIYPEHLRRTTTKKILTDLADAQLRYRVLTEAFEWEEWFEGDASSLMGTLRRAQESLTNDDIVEATATALSIHLESIAELWRGQTGACDRLSRLLGIGIAKRERTSAAIERRETAAKISALVLANAFIFQEQLALSDSRVNTLRKLKKRSDLVEATSEQWRRIWVEINYVPIFHLGERILDELPATVSTTTSVRSLLNEAHKICAQQSALRHDLMGRIYHRLLHHAKFLGTYYTSVSAATLLLKITLSLDWGIDFGRKRKLQQFRVGDLACGTGTLLMAAAQALTDDFIKNRSLGARKIRAKDLSTLHSTLMQSVLHGYDIQPSAVHLTASTLALLAPEVAFEKMSLYVMPIGIDHGKARLGSLDFLDGNEIPTQFSLDSSHLDAVQSSASRTEYVNAKVPRLDLCVMNPPFVSSRYGNRLFGSMPDVRPRLQKMLSAQARKLGISATAGLGALFVPLAEKHLGEGSRIAFVLPIALATGESWGTVRKFLTERFHIEVVITSHDSARTNFSENTDLSELLLVARKLGGDERPGNIAYVALRRNPTSIHESLDVSARISRALRDCRNRRRSVLVRSASAVVAEVTTLPSPKGSANWTNAIFAQGILANVFAHLEQCGDLILPNRSTGYPVPMTQLEQLGSIGYDVRDITDAFEVLPDDSEWTPYPAFWNHNAERVLQISQRPNSYLVPRSAAIEGRRLKSATAVWSKSGRILLVSRLWPVTHKVLATGFETKMLGNTWWAFDDGALSLRQRKALLLWFNSTLGLLNYYGRRAITRSAWMQMKKRAWSSMPVLNVVALTSAQLRTLALAYDAHASKELLPLAQLDVDPRREKIDRAICRALQLPNLDPLREMLAHESGLTAE